MEQKQLKTIDKIVENRRDKFEKIADTKDKIKEWEADKKQLAVEHAAKLKNVKKSKHRDSVELDYTNKHATYVQERNWNKSASEIKAEMKKNRE